ncbi:MAG: hypothetical protein ACR2J0_02850 [Mycobacteriales bacterium]
MGFSMKARHLPPRLATGAFILSSGLSKRGADEATAAGVHGMAAGSYPFLGNIEPRTFTKLLSAGEITLGSALLLPVIPTALAGAALMAFSGGLVGLYLRTPGMREPGSLRPTQQGIGIAKDVWMLAIGASFVLDSRTRD